MTIFIVLGTLLGSLAYAADPPLSVCELARVGEQFDGKTIRIKGVWRKAFAESKIFEELVDDRCSNVEIHVVATDASLPHPPPPGYKLDLRSTRKADRIAQRALATGRDLSATIVGVLYAQKKDDYVPAKPLSTKLTIPPHHKWYPFVLLIQAVPEVKER